MTVEPSSSVSSTEMDSARRDDSNADLLANLTWVRRLVLAIVRDDAVADDVAQDVVWSAWNRSPNERPSSLAALRAWLATAARRAAIDRARSETARRAREQAVSRPEADGGSAEAVERGARSRRVVDAVMQLAEPYRSAILLRYLDQLPMAEVAERLGASESTVRKRLTTGLALLRSRLDDEFGEDSRSWSVALLGVEVQKTAAMSVPTVGLWAIVQGALVMNAKFVAAGIGIVIVGLATWFATSNLDTVSGESARAESASSELTGLANPPTQDAQRSRADSVDPAMPSAISAADSGAFVTVQSSIGLSLPFVDVQDARGDWQRAELDDDRCAVDPAIALPRLLRAPGHVPMSVTRLGEELVLEPDGLLTLEAEGLRTRTRSIRVASRFGLGADSMTPEMRQSVAFGFLSDDTWCVAVSHDLVRGAVFRDELDVEILWPDHQRADVHLRTLPGVRGTWTVPVDRGTEGSSLRLHVRRPTDQPTGDVVFQVAVAHDTHHDPVVVDRFAWGSAVVYDPRSFWMDEQRLDAESSEHTFDFLPTGVPLTLVAHDKSTCAYGRVSFVHDGTDRTLELKPAFVLRGSLLAADDESPVPTAKFIWEFRDESETEYQWRCEKFPIVTDPAGRFEARGPMHMPLTEAMTLEPPSRLSIQVMAAGFDDFERTVDTAGAREFDCGELLLTRRSAQITLTPGHGVSPKSLDGMELRTSSILDVYWEMRGGDVNTDGSMSVFLQGAEESPNDRHLFATRSAANGDFGRPWPSEPGRWLMIHVILDDRDETWLFERHESGSYQAVPRREVDLDVKCAAVPRDHESWKLGWQLHDQWGTFGVATPCVVGELRRVHFSMPVGAQLWWSARGHTPSGVQGASANVGGSASIESLQGRLVLR